MADDENREVRGPLRACSQLARIDVVSQDTVAEAYEKVSDMWLLPRVAGGRRGARQDRFFPFSRTALPLPLHRPVARGDLE